MSTMRASARRHGVSTSVWIVSIVVILETDPPLLVPCFLDPDTPTQRNTDIYWKRNPLVNDVLTIFPCRNNLIFIVKVECRVVPTRRYFLNAHTYFPSLSFSE